MTLLRRLAIFFAVLLPLVAPSKARAEPKVIDISSGLPSDDVPLGSAFVLQVKPTAAATGVYVLFVEYADGAFGSKAGSEYNSCTSIAKDLDFDPEKLRARASSPGKLVVGDVAAPRSSGKAAFKWRPAFLLPPAPSDDKGVMTRAPTDGTVKIAVPSTRFFKRGAHYCLLVNEDRPDPEAVLRMDQIRSCPATGVCEALSKTSFSHLSNEKQEAVKKIAVDLFGVHKDSVDIAIDLTPVGTFNGVYDRLVVSPCQAPATQSPTDATAQLLVALLLKRGTLTIDDGGRVVPKGGTAALKSIRVDMTAIPAMLSGTFVDASQNAIALDLGKASDLSIGVDWTAEQLLRLGAGSIATSESIAAGSSETKLPDNLSATRDAFASFSATDLEKGTGTALELRITEIEKRMNALNDALSKTQGPPNGTLKTACASASTDRSDLVSAAVVAWWEKGGRATTKLQQRAQALRDHFGRLRKKGTDEAVHLRSINNILHSDVTLGLDAKAWVTSYITPTVGFAEVPIGGFITPTIMLSLSPFAHPVDEPMWTSGYPRKDARRLVSLDFGISPQTGTFGPSSRFTVVATGIPPLLAGIGLHALPYVNVSTGVIVVGAKRSTLPGELTRPTPYPYVSVAVEANIPDIIVNLVSEKSATGN